MLKEILKKWLSLFYIFLNATLETTPRHYFEMSIKKNGSKE